MWYYQVTKDKQGFSIREIVKVGRNVLWTDPIGEYHETKAELIENLEMQLKDAKGRKVRKIKETQ